MFKGSVARTEEPAISPDGSTCQIITITHAQPPSASANFVDDDSDYEIHCRETNEKPRTESYVCDVIVSSLNPNARRVRLFDGGLGNGAIATAALDAIHAHAPEASVDFIAKEFKSSLVVQNFKNIASWIAHNPHSRIAVTNMAFAHATNFSPAEGSKKPLVIERIVLAGNSEEEFLTQLNKHEDFIHERWKPNTNNAVLEIIHDDTHYPSLVDEIRESGKPELDFAILSQAWRNAQTADFKGNKVLAPTAEGLAEKGILIGIHAADTGFIRDSVAKFWPDHHDKLGIHSIEAIAAAAELTKKGFRLDVGDSIYQLRGPFDDSKAAALDREVNYAGQVSKAIKENGPIRERRIAHYEAALAQNGEDIALLNRTFTVTRAARFG